MGSEYLSGGKRAKIIFELRLKAIEIEIEDW